MIVSVNDRHFNCGKVPAEISLLQWLRLKLTGEVKVFDAIKAGWRGELPFFVFKCTNCGELALDYRHGHYGRLDCPICNRRSERVRAVVREVQLEATVR